jgi:hypothetical protein
MALLRVTCYCGPCGSLYDLDDDRARIEHDGSVTGTFGSDADFCPRCDHHVERVAVLACIDGDWFAGG